MDDSSESSTELNCDFLSWTAEDVAEWIKIIGFPIYQNCFLENHINGRKLILINASMLCKIGIRDFNDITAIAAEIRELIYTEDPDWKRNISLPPRSDWGMYLEMHTRTNKEHDDEEFKKFKIFHRDTIWQPPLDNTGKIQACFRRQLALLAKETNIESISSLSESGAGETIKSESGGSMTGGAGESITYASRENIKSVSGGSMTGGSGERVTYAARENKKSGSSEDYI